jgi:sugar phosphate isomerase/epimerase
VKGEFALKLGVLTVFYQNQPIGTVLDHVAKMGLQSVELGTGARLGNAHCKPEELLKSHAHAREFRKAVTDRSLIISGLSSDGNPLPSVEKGLTRAVTFLKEVLLYEQPSARRWA